LDTYLNNDYDSAQFYFHVFRFNSSGFSAVFSTLKFNSIQILQKSRSNSVNRMVRRLRRCKDIYFGLYGRLKVKVYSLHTHVGHPFTSVSTAQYCGHNTWGQSKQSHLLHPRLFLFLWLKGQSGWGSQKIGSHGPAEKVFCVTLSCMSELVQKLTY